METGTGRKLFCNCNDTWKLGSGVGDVIDFPNRDDDDGKPCPVCGYYRWFYLNSNDEPKGENND